MKHPRTLELPDETPGRVWLHSMPGTMEPLEEFIGWAVDQKVDTVVCLNPRRELEHSSRGYAVKMADGSLPWQTLHHPVPNMCAPADVREYVGTVREVADRVRAGRRLVIHCAYGIGRTGMTAAALLMTLGCSRSDACERVVKAGSMAETDDQLGVLEAFETPEDAA